MKTNELISIIVPVYNVEKHIERCLNSILDQLYYNMEVILVDDGSTDNSGKICDEYSSVDSRFKVIHKENGGLVSSRNYGLEFALGDYIGFVDSDDWIEPSMYEKMYNNIKVNNSEICICNYIIDSSRHSKNIKLPFEFDVLNKQEVMDYILPSLISSEDLDNNKIQMHGSVCRMLISHDLIKKHNIRFQLDLMEDKIFNIQLYLKCNRVSVDKGYYYHYCIYPNTLSTKFREQRFELLKKIDSVIENTIKAEKLYDAYKSRLMVQYITFVIMSIVNELHPSNYRLRNQKIDTIRSICTDEKLLRVVNDPTIKVKSFKKKMVLKALKRNQPYFLFYYYSLACAFYNIKKKYLIPK